MIQPDNLESKVWRYMDLAKFAQMLEYRGLFFVRLDRLLDPFEGFNGVRGRSLLSIFDDDPRSREKVREFFQSNFVDGRQRIIVNCWCLSDWESAAMWTQFGKTADAVCVRSTYAKLRQTLPRDIKLGLVEYGREYPTHLMEAAFYKSEEYRYENEVRAVTFNAGDDEDSLPEYGKWIDVSLDQLIEAIYVAPTANVWLGELVKRMLRTYGIGDTPVFESALRESPSF
jgi:hypothetical protein